VTTGVSNNYAAMLVADELIYLFSSILSIFVLINITVSLLN
jgi:hypothetical protein